MNPMALVQFMLRGDTAPAAMLARAIAHQIEVRYPGHQWRIDVSDARRVITLNHLLLSGRYGMLTPMRKQTNEDLVQEVVRQAGELLERYGLARGRLDDDQWGALPRDFAREPVADHG